MDHPGKAAAHRMLRESGYSEFKSSDIHQPGEGAAKSAVGKHEAHLHPGQPKTKLRGGGRIKGEHAKARVDRRARGGSITECQPDDDMGNNVKDSGRARGGAMKRADGGATQNAPKPVNGGWQTDDGNIWPTQAAAKAGKDQPQSRARGGHVGKGKGKTVININAGGDKGGDQQHDQQVFQAGAQQGAKMVAQKLAGAGGGAPPRPPGAGPMPPPGMPPGGMPPGGGAPPGAMPPRPPMMPPPGGPPPGMPMHASGGALRDRKGRFLGGGV